MTEHAEMALWLTLFAALERALPARALLTLPARIAARTPRARDLPRARSEAQQLERARVLALRTSRVLRGTRCLHRALAARLWLARRGVTRVTVVLGLRHVGRDEGHGLTGHAWLELRASEGGTRTAFLEGHPRYTSVLREDTYERPASEVFVGSMRRERTYPLVVAPAQRSGSSSTDEGAAHTACSMTRS